MLIRIVQGHVPDIFDGSFQCKHLVKWRVQAIFHSKLQQGDEEMRVIFLCRGALEKIKQIERKRLPPHVTNVGMPMAKNIE